MFSWMYLATATLRRFDAEGRRQEDEPFLQWSLEYAFARAQDAFDGLLRNLPVPGLSWLVRGPIWWWVLDPAEAETIAAADAARADAVAVDAFSLEEYAAGR